MVRHVILWKLKEMPDAEKAAVKAGIQTGLEGLTGQIPGLLELHVYTDALPSSANADLMLDAVFTDIFPDAVKIGMDHLTHSVLHKYCLCNIL